MKRNRNVIATLAMAIAVIMLIVLAPLVVNTQRSAHAAATVYSVAQGAVEANFSHWSAGGVPSRGINRLKMQVGTATLDSSYATGGEVLDLSATFPNAVLVCMLASEQGHSFEYVHATASAPATGLIKAYVGAGTEVSSATDMSFFVVEYLAVGW